MSDILQEVDEALKQDRMLKIWQNYGPYIIAGIVGIVLITAGKSFFEYRHRTVSEAATSDLMKVLDAESGITADALNKYIETHRTGAAVLANLHLAGAYLDQGDKAKALEALGSIGTDKKSSEFYKDFSKLLSLQIQMDQVGSDEEFKTLESELTALVDNEKSTWRHHARLNRAVLFAMQGSYEAALSDLELIRTAANIPASLIQRASALAQLYAVRKAGSES